MTFIAASFVFDIPQHTLNSAFMHTHTSIHPPSHAHVLTSPTPFLTHTHTVFVSNHLTIWDPFWFDGLFDKDMTFIAASFVFDLPKHTLNGTFMNFHTSNHPPSHAR